MDLKIWLDMFRLGLPVLEKILRPILIYLFLVIGLRLGGKRELAQLNPFDLVVLLTIANTVQNAIIGDDNSVTGGVIGAATLLVINYVVVGYLSRHPRLDRIVKGQPDALIEHGKVRKGRLKQEHITLEELKEAAQRQGFASLEEVDRAVLGATGSIGFVRREPPVEEVRHRELINRLELLSREVSRLRPSAEPPATA